MKKTSILISLTVAIVVALIAGCTTPKEFTNPDGSTSTNYVSDPRLVTAIEAARAANTASAPFNPYAYLVEIGLGAAAVGAGWVAKRKTDKAAANELLLKTVIQAIDALDDQKVKDSIAEYATKAGTEARLNTAVQKVGTGAI